MDKGLLWYDNQKVDDLNEKIASAVNYFISKYDCLPEVCYVNPVSLGKDEAYYDEKIKILPNNRVIPNHIWLEFPKK